MNSHTCKITVTSWDEAEPQVRPVRQAVFIEEQKVPPELEWDGLDDGARHAIVQLNDQQIIGCGRLLPTGQIGRMAIMKDHRRQGIGSALLVALENEARRLNYSAVFLHAQNQALPFYERQDYHAEKDVFHEADIPHRKCIKYL